MKGFAKIALTVALIAVIVLSIVVASVAWFTSNPEVNANDVTLDAARTLTVEFDDSVDGTTYKYNGEIGNVATGLDAPYVYEAGGFKVNITSLSSDNHFGKIKVEFGTVEIRYATGTISDVLITDLFHITANVYTQDNNGNYVKDGANNAIRARTQEDEGTRYAMFVENLTIADDGVLMQTANNATSTALFPENHYGYEITFTFTFLPEAAYAVWEAAATAAPASTAAIPNVYGYERAADGTYIGVVNYTLYKAKYHYGLTRYARIGNAEPYSYEPNENGDYVRVVTSYANSNVDRYSIAFTEDSGGTHYKYQDEYISNGAATTAEKAGVKGNIVATQSASGDYIKVGNEYLLFDTYTQIDGFPYSDDHYRGEKFYFQVSCSVEEVTQ